MMIILVLGAACMWACSKDLPDAGGSAMETLANEWWVTDNGTKIRKISTYNTSNTQDSMWVSMIKAPDTFQVKVLVDVASLTFSALNSKNVNGKLISSVSITNGKIFPKGGKSQTGNITDSIYLEAVYSNDPGVKHVFSGVARTRFEADDH
jgi:hypothetical protein